MECVPFPFYLMQLSVVFPLSAYSKGCHTAAAAAAAAKRADVRGKNAWLQCPLVVAGGISVAETSLRSSDRFSSQ